MDTQAREAAKARTLALIDDTSEELLRFVSTFVQRPSVNPGRAFAGDPSGTKVCQEWLHDQLVEFGAFDTVDLWEAAPDQPNLAAVIRGTGDGGSSLMFNGHTDTFGVGPEQRAQWVGGDPWSGHVEGGKLYGRGSTDMKAGIAAFVWAARMVRRAGLRTAADLILTMTIGEETGEPDLGPYSFLDRGYRADLIVNAEGTDLRVCSAAVGFFFFRITVEGKSLHPAARHRSVYPHAQEADPPGVDAVEKMRAIMDALSHLERDWALYQRHPLMEPGNMNLCLVSIRGGGYRGAMPEDCEAVYAAVFNPALTGEEVITEVRQVVDGVAHADTWLRRHPPVIDYPIIHMVLEAVDVPMDHPAVVALMGAYRGALGREAELGCMTGPGDANILTGRNQPTIVFGPGELSYGAHGPNEYVPIQQVIAACKVYATLVIDWCGAVED